MTEDWEFFVGLVVVLLVLFMPGGLAGIPGLFKGKLGGGD
jgi:ABC-type branched-subunit amino acid transport system permease subunit